MLALLLRPLLSDAFSAMRTFFVRSSRLRSSRVSSSSQSAPEGREAFQLLFEERVIVSRTGLPSMLSPASVNSFSSGLRKGTSSRIPSGAQQEKRAKASNTPIIILCFISIINYVSLTHSIWR